MIFTEQQQFTKIEITPHYLATTYQQATAEQNAAFAQALSLVSSPPSHWSSGDVKVIRDTSLVSLWFYLRFIAGYSGPYNKLNHDLHVDMCNFRQKMIRPGAKGAAFMPRGHLKSTVFTHGAAGWEVLRNPDLRMGIISSIYDRAVEFMHTTQRTFDENDLFAFLFPEYVPQKGAKRWNDIEMVLPNRSRNMPEPNIKAVSALSSTQGNHFDLLQIDDIVGEKQLNAARGAILEMERIANWMRTAMRTLLISWKESRVMVAATRYSINDAYEFIMSSIREQHGYWGGVPYEVNEHGVWDVYYRLVEEEGIIIYPEAISREELNQLRNDDPWTYYTQYLNLPHEAGITEFNKYDLKKCDLAFDGNHWKIALFDSEIDLADCDVVMAIDPAATDKQKSARTSRTAVVTIATDAKGRRFIIDIKAGFVNPSAMFEWIFGVFKTFRNYLRKGSLETGGPFKILYPILREEMQRRNDWIPVSPASVTGDKNARIRSNLQPLLEYGSLYVVERFYDMLMAELRGFPTSPMKDIIDALADAISISIVPDDRESIEDFSMVAAGGRSKTTGY